MKSIIILFSIMISNQYRVNGFSNLNKQNALCSLFYTWADGFNQDPLIVRLNYLAEYFW